MLKLWNSPQSEAKWWITTSRVKPTRLSEHLSSKTIGLKNTSQTLQKSHKYYRITFFDTELFPQIIKIEVCIFANLHRSLDSKTQPCTKHWSYLKSIGQNNQFSHQTIFVQLQFFWRPSPSTHITFANIFTVLELCRLLHHLFIVSSR